MVSRVVGEGEGAVVKVAVEMAKLIVSKGRVFVLAGKEAVDAAHELTLTEGFRLERRLFHGLFATADQIEGACPRCRPRDFADHEARLGQGGRRSRRSARRTSCTRERTTRETVKSVPYTCFAMELTSRKHLPSSMVPLESPYLISLQ